MLVATQRQYLLDQTAEQRTKLAALDRQRAQKEAERATSAATIAKIEAMIPLLQDAARHPQDAVRQADRLERSSILQT